MTKRKLKMIARYLASECTEQERRDIEEWANSSRKSREDFKEIREIWALSKAQKGDWNSWRAVPSLRKKLINAAAETDNDHKGKVLLYRIIPEKEKAGRFSVGRFAQIAAALVLLAGIGYVAAYFKGAAQDSSALDHGQAVAYERVSTRPGQRVTISLENGTKVLLNSASSLRYAVGRDGTRRFFLTGEAYFDVVHAHRRPYVIRTENAIIKDIGTRFDVEAWPGDDQTQVTVSEGEVSLKPTGKPAGLHATLVGGQYSVVRGGQIVVPPSFTNVADRIAWVKGELVFHDELIKRVFKGLQREYGIDCRVLEPSILERTLTATFTDRQTPQEVLKIIALSLKLNYRTSKDSVLFSMKGPFVSQQ